MTTPGNNSPVFEPRASEAVDEQLRLWIWEQIKKHDDSLVALQPAFDLILNKIDELRAQQPAQPVADAQPGRHPLEAYADSYAQMARDGDGRVDCRSVEVDIRQNMIPATRFKTAPTPPDTNVVQATGGVVEALRDFVAWVDTWVSNPVGAYSVDALNGLFGMARDRIAALSAKEGRS